MSGTYAVTMGDRGASSSRPSYASSPGSIPGSRWSSSGRDDGIVLLTREQLKRRVRDDLVGLDLVGDLLAERTRAAAAEDRP